MATITTRAGKGSPLTNTEVDANFTNLNTDKIEVGDLSVSTGAASGGGTLAYTSGVFTFAPADLSSYITGLSGLGITATAAELNLLDGIPATLTTAELGYVDGVTSSIQTQLNNKEPADTTILKDADIGSSVLAFDTNLQGFVTAFTIPTTDGTSGQALITNGSGSIAFGDVDALPSQTGNNGKYLTTDGTAASWDEISAGEFVYTRSNYTATASQTTFNATYDLGYVDVFLNGIKLLVGTEFTATSETDIVLAVGAAAGDIVEILAYETFNNVIAYKNPDGGFANSVYTSVQSVDGGSA